MRRRQAFLFYLHHRYGILADYADTCALLVSRVNGSSCHWPITSAADARWGHSICDHSRTKTACTRGTQLSVANTSTACPQLCGTHAKLTEEGCSVVHMRRRFRVSSGSFGTHYYSLLEFTHMFALDDAQTPRLRRRYRLNGEP